jgi:hypothetical protein
MSIISIAFLVAFVHVHDKFEHVVLLSSDSGILSNSAPPIGSFIRHVRNDYNMNQFFKIDKYTGSHMRLTCERTGVSLADNY